MSHLGNFLQRYLESKQLSQRALAAELGLAVSHVSRILAGQRKWLDVETVQKMLKGVGSERRLQAELLRAYLLDQCPTLAGSLITISVDENIPSGKVKETAARYGASGEQSATLSPTLGPKLLRIVQKLAAMAQECPEFQRVLEDLTKLEVTRRRR
jgi:transcriptional regulator with XRE-family HTH domain